MNSFKVLNIGEAFTVDTQYGKKEKVTVKLEETTTKQKYAAGYFIPKNGIPFKMGEEILADVEVSGKYTNLKSVEKFTLPPPAPEAEEKVDWDGKEKRDFKGRSLMYASEAIKHCWPEKTFKDEGEYLGILFMTAERILDWIYQDREPGEE